MMTDSNLKPEVDIEQLVQQFFDWIVFPVTDHEHPLDKQDALFWDFALDWVKRRNWAHSVGFN